MFKKILITCLTVFSVQVFSDGWMPTAKTIKEIIIEGSETSGTALIVIEGGVPADNIPSECNSAYNTVDLTTEKGRAILSIALAARISDKPVRLALTTCKGTRPLISHIML